MSEPIYLETRGAIALVVLNRPDKRNALSTEMWQAIPELVATVADDPEVKVLILRGASPRPSAPAPTSASSMRCTPRARRGRPIGAWSAPPMPR